MGMTTKAEWNDIAHKIAGSINNTIEAYIIQWGEQLMVEQCEELFGRGVIYIVEPNPTGYNSHKTTGDGKTVYIALDKVDTTVPGDMLPSLYQNNTVVDGVIVR
jgi:hypothetical protein